MAHTLTIVEPIWPMLQNLSKTLLYTYLIGNQYWSLLDIVADHVIYDQSDLQKTSDAEDWALLHHYSDAQIKTQSGYFQYGVFNQYCKQVHFFHLIPLQVI